MDFRVGGQFRIVMAHEGGLVFVTTGTFDNIVACERFTMVTHLDEHPDEFIEIFRREIPTLRTCRSSGTLRLDLRVVVLPRSSR